VRWLDSPIRLTVPPFATIFEVLMTDAAYCFGKY
jgi:hypothetical protein